MLLAMLSERNQSQITWCMVPLTESSKSGENYPLLLKVSMEVTPGVVVHGRGIPGCCSCSAFDLRSGFTPPSPTSALSCVCVCVCVCENLWHCILLISMHFFLFKNIYLSGFARS